MKCVKGASTAIFVDFGCATLKAKKVLYNWLNQNISPKSSRLGLTLFFEAIKTVVEGEKFGVTMQQKLFFF